MGKPCWCLACQTALGNRVCWRGRRTSLPQQTDWPNVSQASCHAFQRIRALCTSCEGLSSSSAGSWGLRRHRSRAWTRSDQTRCGTRLVSASVLPWAGAACGCRGRQQRKPVAAPDAADDLGLQWVFSPCRFVETLNVTASAGAQASTPAANSPSHNLYGEMLSGEANRPAFGEFLRRT